MAKFLSPLICQWISKKNWEITSPLMYESDILSEVISVPVGFITDFASCPRVPIAYLLAGNTAHESSVIHDYLYQIQPCTRFQADNVFMEAMMVTGIPRWRFELMYLAVRAFGWIPWKNSEERKLKLKGLT